jgi:hypothetical protein
MRRSDMSNPILDELYAQRTVDARERPDPRVRTDPRVISERERVPLGGNRMRLTLEERPGYHRHWINDVGDRIERAQRGGYTFIPKAGARVGTGPESGHTDLGEVISCVVGKHEDGRPLRAYAMEIKREYYEADQALKGAAIRQTEADIQRGRIQAQDGDNSNRYIPEEGISID